MWIGKAVAFLFFKGCASWMPLLLAGQINFPIFTYMLLLIVVILVFVIVYLSKKPSSSSMNNASIPPVETANDLNSDLAELQKSITDLSQKLKETQLRLAVVAKESEDKSIILKNFSQLLESLENNPRKESIVWNEIRRQLDHHHQKDEKIFALQMTELNQENIKKLKASYPVLTNYDLKLCTLIMAGLNSKEIANSLEVLPSSIYISRSRLRKKLNIENDDDLYGFLTRLL